MVKSGIMKGSLKINQIEKMSLLETINIKNIDHLGIVAGLIDEIEIVEIIDEKCRIFKR